MAGIDQARPACSLGGWSKRASPGSQCSGITTTGVKISIRTIPIPTGGTITTISSMDCGHTCCRGLTKLLSTAGRHGRARVAGRDPRSLYGEFGRAPLSPASGTSRAPAPDANIGAASTPSCWPAPVSLGDGDWRLRRPWSLPTVDSVRSLGRDCHADVRPRNRPAMHYTDHWTPVQSERWASHRVDLHGPWVVTALKHVAVRHTLPPR